MAVRLPWDMPLCRKYVEKEIGLARQPTAVSLAGAIIEHPEFGFLLQLRDEAAPTHPLHWGLFGGHIEPGEAPETTLWRELHEELGFTPAMALAWQLVQCNPWSGGGTQYIYHILTHATPADLVLGEGKEMRFIAPQHLGECRFAANIGEVLADHLSGRRDNLGRST